MVREQVRKCEVGVGEEQEESKPKDERKNTENIKEHVNINETVMKNEINIHCLE